MVENEVCAFRSSVFKTFLSFHLFVLGRGNYPDDMNSCLAWNRTLSIRRGTPQIWRCTQEQKTKRYATSQAAAVPTEAKHIVRGENSIHFSWGSDSQLSTTHRSLVRSMLREASYLPDPNARLFVKAKIIHDSKKSAFRAWEHRDDPDFASRAKVNARHSLNRLRRANEGERSALLRVLFMTYGRIGHRRYELLRPIYQVDTKSTHDLVDFLKSQKSRGETSEQDYDPLDGPEIEVMPMQPEEAITQDHTSHDNLPVLTPEIFALAKSQKEANPPTHTRKNPRHLKPSIPATNARMLPMPRKRIKNMHKKWYADLLNRIHPPLPTKEWEQLRDWSRGQNLPQIRIPRRSNPAPAAPARHFGTYSALEAIVIQGRIDKTVYGNREAHEITPRFMQRLWATVFSNCPYMIFDDEKKKWNVLWGHHELAAPMLTEVQKVMDDGTLPT